MKLAEWLRAVSSHDRAIVAGRAKTTVSYLYHVAGGHRTPSVALAMGIEAATMRYTPDAVVTRAELRPDVWG